MYREEDEVYVFNGKGLYKKSMIIQNSRNDQEHFTVIGDDDEGVSVVLNIPRSYIMENYEVDKISKLMIKETAWELDSPSDNEEVDSYVKGEDDESFTVIHDMTLDGIAEHLGSNFSTVHEFEKWFKEMFSHYSPNGIYKLDDGYYIVINN